MLPWIKKQNYLKRAVALILLVFAAAFLFLTFQMVFAQDSSELFGLQPVEQNIGLASTDIRLIIARIIRAVLGLLGIIAVGLMIYAGYTIMTSEGNEEKVAQGKKIMINAVIGLVIILSAFAIVQFVLNALSKGSGIIQPGAGEGKPKFETFIGSGALGKVIKDHYPLRDQKNVPRNTKIAITFADAIIPSSLIEDTNNNGTYGDCIQDGNFSWQEDCDHLKSSALEIYQSANKDTAPLPVIGAAALTTYSDGKAYTFVFRPFDSIGSDTEDVWHTVRVTNNIKKEVNGDEIGIFEGRFSSYYKWEFQTNTSIDFKPPQIVDVYPNAGGIEPRNSIVQINFSEPVDPTMAQGTAGGSSVFSNIIFADKDISGEWKISNGYQTVEFVSSQSCGNNSCGQLMYCLPVSSCANPADTNCKQDYAVLLRTADLLTSDKPFEAVPLSGIMDMAGNALDGDKDDNPDDKPTVANPKLIGVEDKKADNYYWEFKIQNKIDRTAPYIKQILPGIDAEGVDENVPVEITFSKRLWSDTIKDVSIEEYPKNFCYEEDKCLDDIWFLPIATLLNGTTKINILHREFGPNNADLYYFPSIPSTVKSINQNCLYPGRGPNGAQGTSPVCVYEEDEAGNPIINQNCVPVDFNAGTDTGCVQKSDDNLLQPTISDCLTHLKDPSISPVSSEE